MSCVALMPDDRALSRAFAIPWMEYCCQFDLQRCMRGSRPGSHSRGGMMGMPCPEERDCLPRNMDFGPVEWGSKMTSLMGWLGSLSMLNRKEDSKDRVMVCSVSTVWKAEVLQLQWWVSSFAVQRVVIQGVSAWCSDCLKFWALRVRAWCM